MEYLTAALVLILWRGVFLVSALWDATTAPEGGRQ